MPFKFSNLKIKDVVLIESVKFKDDRGFFEEVFKVPDFKNLGIDLNVKQINFSHSTKGVLRGLHYQAKPYGQAKLVRCARGKIYDVAVDIRPNSATFGQYVKVELSEENKQMLFIPEGFAHGFLVLSDEAEFCYKCDDFYHANDEGGLAWNDPDIGIEWPEVDVPLNLSEKDQKWKGIAESFPNR